MNEVVILDILTNLPIIPILSWIVAIFWIIFSFAITYHWIVYSRNVVAMVLALSLHYGISLALIGLIVTNL